MYTKTWGILILLFVTCDQRGATKGDSYCVCKRTGTSNYPIQVYLTPGGVYNGGEQALHLVIGTRVLSRTAVAAASEKELPFWSIILISMGCALVLMTLWCLLCIICTISRPAMRTQNNWVQSYFPHLAFRWGLNEDPIPTISG